MRPEGFWYLRFGAVSLLEAGLATQRAAQRRGVMVQAERGAGHDGCLEMRRGNQQALKPLEGQPKVVLGCSTSKTFSLWC